MQLCMNVCTFVCSLCACAVLSVLRYNLGWSVRGKLLTALHTWRYVLVTQNQPETLAHVLS
jgi:hypothetical protein